MTSQQLIHIIDEDGSFREQFPGEFRHTELYQKGLDYNVVAILGAQSTGKSTLLNLLFETHFATMDSSRGRHQTTKGVWLAKSAFSDTLVLDVEGTDSRERGEDAAGFERKMALFSLVMSQILIVNLWAVDIGRYNAANYGILKTVFELNLQLFQSSRTSKTLLLFVIRDHTASPLERLQEEVMSDVEKIWKDIGKPDKYQGSAVRDFFDFQFTSLPHKELQADEFRSKALLLRDRFANAGSADYLWRQAYKADIPADGLASFAESVWKTIQENKDLDLPTQKVMLSTFRCDEILETAYAHFGEQLAALRRTLDAIGANDDAAALPDFGVRARTLLQATLEEYALPASRYDREVADKKRQSLMGKMTKDLYELYVRQLAAVMRDAARRFDADLVRLFPPGGDEAAADFAATADAALGTALEWFDEQAKAATPDGVEWSTDGEAGALRKALQQKVAAERARQLSLLLAELQKFLRRTLAARVTRFLDDADANVWPRIREQLAQSEADVEKQVERKLAGLGLAADQEAKTRDEVRHSAAKVVREKAREACQQLAFKLEKSFDRLFRYDELTGVPRRWKPEDDLNKIYAAACERSDELLERLVIIRLRPELDAVRLTPSVEDEIGAENIALAFDDVTNARDKLTRYREAAYMQAARDQEAVSTRLQIPKFMWLLVLVLGFNELSALVSMVLFNPAILFLFILFSLIIWAIYMANLQGPALSLLEMTLQKTTSAATDRVRSQFGGAAAAADADSDSASRKPPPRPKAD